MVVTYLEEKIRGDLYVEVGKKMVSFFVIPWMTENKTKCAAIIHKKKISNDKKIDKEEAETDKSEHQTSLLGIISITIVNGGKPKGLTLKKENPPRENG